MENAIVKILSRIDTNNLPVLPKVLVDLLDAIQRQDVNIDNLAYIMGQDASISANILSAVNSPYYRQWGEVTSLKKMIQIMGLKTVKALIMTRAIQQFFARVPADQQGHLEVIWYQSLTCAHLARNLAQLTAYDFPDEMYLAGLTHRLGQLLLMQCFPAEYPDFLVAHPDGDAAAERAKFGAAHHEVGAYVIASWNLHSHIADAILFQNQSVEIISDSVSIVKIINLACKLSNINAENKYFIFGQANRLFGLNQSLVASMLEDVSVLVNETATNLGIQISHATHNRPNSLTTPEQRSIVQEQLGERVKNIAFKAAIQAPLHMVSGYEKLAATLKRDMSVLFGFSVSALFVYQPEFNSLESVAEEPEENTTPEASCSITLNNKDSLLAKAWHSQKVLHSFNLDKSNPNAQYDRKIYQLLKTEDMIVFPLIQGGKILGVIAAGLKRTDVKRIKLNIAFIDLFIGEVAKILITLQEQEASPEHPENLTTIQAHYALYARKLGHEINNPLSIINNYLYLLSLKLGSEHVDQIKVIQEEIERVSNITLSLSDFSLASAKTISNVVDLNALITDLIKLFEAGIFKTPVITTRLNLDDKLNNISIHKDKLKQILTNLIKNSVEAMPSGGEIIISTKACKAANGKQTIEIQVQDNGPGLPEAVLRHLFKPIKHQKDRQHAGLGLTICKSLVDELKGEIKYKPSPDQGTTFSIILPHNT